MKRYKYVFQIIMIVILSIGAVNIQMKQVVANDLSQALPFSQDWTDKDLITVSDDWSAVPGIVGYRGDSLTAVTGADPQTILSPNDSGVIDVNADQTNPSTYTTGGVTEFAITNPVVALTGSGTDYVSDFL